VAAGDARDDGGGLGEALRVELRQHRRTETGIQQEMKLAGWKVEIATSLKARTIATNRWLAAVLNMGGLYHVSRLVSAKQKSKQP